MPTTYAADKATVDGPAVMRKVSLRLVPFMALLYFANYLDRVNVGFAALTMNQDLGFSASVYGNGAGILFLGYVLFQVPSNLAVERFGMRAWVSAIMVIWGLLSAAMAFVTDPLSLYVLRFLLGVAEAGFFPGMILFLTIWFPARMRARITGAFMMAIPISNFIGAPLSTAVLGVTGAGLKGWQWLFILQGIPAVVLGLLVLVVLTDRPEKALWLTDTERTWLTGRLAGEQRLRDRLHPASLRKTLLDPRTWLFGVAYFGLALCLYGLTLWLPQIIKGFGGLSNFQVGLATALPYFAGAVMMYLWCAHSDATGERAWHMAIPCIVSGLGLGASAYLIDQPLLAYIALAIAAMGVFTALPSFWPLPTAVLGSGAAAGGIALINAIGNIGGYAGPVILGHAKDATGSYTYGLLTLAAFAIVSAVLAVAMGHDGRTEPSRAPVDAH